MKSTRLRLAIAAPLLAFPLLACSDAQFEEFIKFLGLILMVLAVVAILGLILLIGSVWCLVANYTSPTRRTMIGGKVFGVMYALFGAFGMSASVFQFFAASAVPEFPNTAPVGDGMAQAVIAPDLSSLLIGLAFNSLILLFGAWSFYVALRASQRVKPLT